MINMILATAFIVLLNLNMCVAPADPRNDPRNEYEKLMEELHRAELAGHANPGEPIVGTEQGLPPLPNQSNNSLHTNQLSTGASGTAAVQKSTGEKRKPEEDHGQALKKQKTDMGSQSVTQNTAGRGTRLAANARK